jgi:hypothetical protein
MEKQPIKMPAHRLAGRPSRPFHIGYPLPLFWRKVRSKKDLGPDLPNPPSFPTAADGPFHPLKTGAPERFHFAAAVKRFSRTRLAKNLLFAVESGMVRVPSAAFFRLWIC